MLNNEQAELGLEQLSWQRLVIPAKAGIQI